MATKKNKETERKSARRLAKEESVKKLSEKIKKAKIIGIANLRNLPDRQFQSIRKKLRGKAEFVVAKNSVIRLAAAEAKKAEELVKNLSNPVALIFTEMNPFRLFKFVKANKGKVAAKPGQIAPIDLIVPEGETSLPPGPVLTELKQAKIDARMKDGKVVIGKESVVAKKGEKISDIVAKALQKLDIYPFEVYMEIPAIWEEGIIYTKDVLDIDEAKFMADLVDARKHAFNLSVNCAYLTNENAHLLISMAASEARNLAYNAAVPEKEVIDLLLSKAYREASALAVVAKDAATTSGPEQAEEKKE